MLSTRLILVFLMLIIGESRSIIYGGRELNKYELASIKYLEVRFYNYCFSFVECLVYFSLVVSTFLYGLYIRREYFALQEVMREDQYVRIPCDPAGDGEVCCKCTETGECYFKCFRRWLSILFFVIFLIRAIKAFIILRVVAMQWIELVKIHELMSFDQIVTDVWLLN